MSAKKSKREGRKREKTIHHFSFHAIHQAMQEGHNPFARIPADEIAVSLQRYVDEYLQHPRDRSDFDREFSEQAMPGHTLRLLLAKYAEYCSPVDIFQGLRAINQLEQDIHIDGLTGVGNRRRYDSAMNRQFALYDRIRQKNEQREHGELVEPFEPFSIAIVDIDYFRDINNIAGHRAGDLALKKLTEIIRSTLRGTDSIDRYGGEEFVVRMPNTTAEEAQIAMEKVRAEVEKHFYVECINEIYRVNPKNAQKLYQQRGNTPLTVSIGISSYRPYPESIQRTQADGQTISASLPAHFNPKIFFAEADTALRIAKGDERSEKKMQRNMVCTFPSDVPLALLITREVHEEHFVQQFLTHAQSFQASVESPSALIERYRTQSHYHDAISTVQRIFSSQIIQDALLQNNSADIQHIEGALHSMQESVRVDDLTRLPNRKAYTEFIHQKLQSLSRQDTKNEQGEPLPQPPKNIGMLLFDIDHFKQFNDRFGHLIGDIALRALGDVLQGYSFDAENFVAGAVRQGEFVARIGGEEFTVILDIEADTDVDVVLQAATRIREAIEKKVRQRFLILLESLPLNSEQKEKVKNQLYAITITVGATLAQPQLKI